MDSFILDRSHCDIWNIHQPVTRSPYPFQEEAFHALDELKLHHPEGFSSMLVLPTGAGKTYTAVHWILKNYVDQGVRVLWIAHRSELLRQAAEAFYSDTTVDTLPNRRGFRTYVVSSEFGRSCNISRSDVVIASRQSVCSGSNKDFYLKWAKGSGLKADRKLLLIFDEAHHAAAKSYRTIIDMMKKFIPHVDILGLTATPYRTAKNEQGSLKRIFHTDSGIVYSIDMNTLIRAGILANPMNTEVKTDLDMTELFNPQQLLKISRNDLTSLDEKDLRKLSENAGRNRLIVDTYLKNREKYGKTIVFALDVLNAVALHAAFQNAGVRSEYVVSGLSAGLNRSLSTERNPQIIRAFRDGKFDVLINVNILTEGTDIPNIQTVFLARPTTSRILMTQMIGRGLRGEAAGGTKETNLVYFIDNWRDMVSFVSPKALLDGEDCQTFTPQNRRESLMHYIQLSDLESCAASLYHHVPPVSARVKNIIPYGIIHCSYWEEELEISRDILVYDETKAAFTQILSEIVTLFSRDDMPPADQIASELYFRYCGDGSYLGISSSIIRDLILSYLSSGEMPVIQPLEDRVSLYEIAEHLSSAPLSEVQLENALEYIWEGNPLVRSWYQHDFYVGMMHVYYSRIHAASLTGPHFILPPKEDMDMGELQKYYPQYYEELRADLKRSVYQDEDGYYYSAIQEPGHDPYRSKTFRDFEIDHIVPISKGGKTVRENLQMILRIQNIRLGAKDK